MDNNTYTQTLTASIQQSRVMEMSTTTQLWIAFIFSLPVYYYF